MSNTPPSITSGTATSEPLTSMLVAKRLLGIVGTESPIFAVSAEMCGDELYLWIREAQSLRLVARIILAKDTEAGHYSLNGSTAF